MARLTTNQTFTSIAEVKQVFGITLPKPYDWRLLSPCVVGEINGLPNLRGTAIATNGILVAIVQQTGLIIGHLDYFVADQDQSMPQDVNRSVVVKAKKTKINIEEFC